MNHPTDQELAQAAISARDRIKEGLEFPVCSELLWHFLSPDSREYPGLCALLRNAWWNGHQAAAGTEPTMHRRIEILEEQVAALRQQMDAIQSASPHRRAIRLEEPPRPAPPVQMQQQAAPTLKEAQEACRQLGGEAATVVRRYLDALPVQRIAERTAVADAVATMLTMVEITREEAMTIFERLRKPIYARWSSGEEGIMGYEPVSPVEMAQAVRSLLVEKLRQQLADKRLAPAQDP